MKKLIIILIFSFSNVFANQFFGDFVNQILVSANVSVENESDSSIINHFSSSRNYMFGLYGNMGRYNLYISAIAKGCYRKGDAINNRGNSISGAYRYIKGVSGIGFGFKILDNYKLSPYIDFIPVQYYHSEKQYNSISDYEIKKSEFGIYTLYNFRWIFKNNINLSMGIYKIFLPFAHYKGEVGINLTIGLLGKKTIETKEIYEK